MRNRVILTLGLTIFTASLILVIYLRRAENLARSIDRAGQVYGGGQVISKPCQISFFNIEETIVSNRVLSENDTGTITIIMSNTSNQECGTIVSLKALNVNVEPAGNVTISVPSGKRSRAYIWLFSPQKLGSFQLNVQAVPYSNTVGITVTNVLGLTAQQAHFLSLIGNFLGPAVTLPGLWGLIKEWKSRNAKQKRSNKQKK